MIIDVAIIYIGVDLMYFNCYEIISSRHSVISIREFYRYTKYRDVLKELR